MFIMVYNKITDYFQVKKDRKSNYQRDRDVTNISITHTHLYIYIYMVTSRYSCKSTTYFFLTDIFKSNKELIKSIIFQTYEDDIPFPEWR